LRIYGVKLHLLGSERAYAAQTPKDGTLHGQIPETQNGSILTWARWFVKVSGELTGIILVEDGIYLPQINLTGLIDHALIRQVYSLTRRKE